MEVIRADHIIVGGGKVLHWMLRIKFVFHGNLYIVPYTYVNKHTEETQVQVGSRSLWGKMDMYLFFAGLLGMLSLHMDLQALNSTNIIPPSISYHGERYS